MKNKIPIPPENCSITNHNRYYLQINCQIKQGYFDETYTYLLQVYDANTRLLLGTATSQTPERITITSLPRDHAGLLLFVRTITNKSITSEAAILYADLKNIKTSGKNIKCFFWEYFIIVHSFRIAHF